MVDARLPKQTGVSDPETGKGTIPEQPPAPAGREPGVGGWLIDPTRRHQIRYWTGTIWSSSVSDNGVRTVDPIEPGHEERHDHGA
jgi:hypothetical protein